jgi:hypothetical protein
VIAPLGLTSTCDKATAGHTPTRDSAERGHRSICSGSEQSTRQEHFKAGTLISAWRYIGEHSGFGGGYTRSPDRHFALPPSISGGTGRIQQDQHLGTRTLVSPSEHSSACDKDGGRQVGSSDPGAVRCRSDCRRPERMARYRCSKTSDFESQQSPVHSKT